MKKVLSMRVATLVERNAWINLGSFAGHLSRSKDDVETYRQSLNLKPVELPETPLTDKYQKGTFATPFVKNPTSEKASLGQEQRLFESQGVLGPRKLHFLDNKRISDILSDATVFENPPAPEPGKRSIKDHQIYYNSTLLELATHPEIIQKVTAILGPNIKLMASSVVVVEPQSRQSEPQKMFSRAERSYHSDSASRNTWVFNEEEQLSNVDPNLVNVWISLTGTDEKKAPLFVVPGSHRLPMITPLMIIRWAEEKKDSSLLKKAHQIFSLPYYSGERGMCAKELIYEFLMDRHPEQLEQYKAYLTQTNPGDCLIFDSHLLHGSELNYSEETRVGIAFRYSKADNPIDYHYDFQDFPDLFTPEQLEKFGVDMTSGKLPILQVAGNKHHQSVQTIRVEELKALLKKQTDPNQDQPAQLAPSGLRNRFRPAENNAGQLQHLPQALPELDQPNCAARSYHVLNNAGLLLFGKAWLPQYAGAIYPGVVAHKFNFTAAGLLTGQRSVFETCFVDKGLSYSQFFESSGIGKLADDHGGLCTFWFGKSPAILQTRSVPLFREEDLEPSAFGLHNRIGDFLSAVPVGHPKENPKRKAFMGLTSHASKMNKTPHIAHWVKTFCQSQLDKTVALDDFVTNLVATVDSHIPGFLNFEDKPFTEYYENSDFTLTISSFIDALADVSFNRNKEDAEKALNNIVPLTRNVLRDNVNSILKAGNNNLIKKWFAIEEIDFTLGNIEKLNDTQLKELGLTILVSFDTTALNLIWTVTYIEMNPAIKAMVILHARGEIEEEPGKLSYLDLVTMESLRMSGAGASAGFRTVRRPCVIEHNGYDLNVPKGMLVWQDKDRASVDPYVFPYPREFNIENIRAVMKTGPNESMNKLLGGRRNEIGAFTSIPVQRHNIRKCPGRFFSVYLQTLVIKELYKNFNVQSNNLSTEQMPFKTKPRPLNTSTLTLSKVE